MNATKTSFQVINGEQIEWDKNGSIPALKWVDTEGNNWRTLASYQFDSDNETYVTIVKKYLQLAGTTDWILARTYPIVADQTKFRILATGLLIENTDGIPSALDNSGNIVDPMGWVTNSKYFTIGIGYNPSGAPVSINYWIYLEMADKEGLTIV